MDSPPSLSTFMLESPFAIKWEIDERELAALKDSNNGYLNTEWFKAANIPGVKFFLAIFPNGLKEDRRGKVCIFLFMKIDDEKNVKAEFEFIIESAEVFQEVQQDYQQLKGEGTILCTTAQLFDPSENFIVGGKFIMKCAGYLYVERENAGIEEVNKWETGDILGRLWERNDKDFTIVVDGKTLQVHKSIIALHSPVFEAMFNSGMNEATQSQMEITDLSYECVEAALELCYNRKISSLNLEEKMVVLQFLDKYDIQDLKVSLEASLIDEISVTNVCELANCSINTNAIKLQNKCLEFLIECSKKCEHPSNLGILDKDLVFKVLENTFYKITKT